MKGNLRGLAVAITPVEPWEFVDEHGSGPFPAVIVDVGSEDSLLLKMEDPIRHAEKTWAYLVAETRDVGDLVEQLSAGHPLDFALTGIAEEQARSDKPFDLGEWRGGLASPASLRVVR